MRRTNIICADKLTIVHFGLFLVQVAKFGWKRNHVTKMSAGIFTRPEGDCSYAIDWDEAYGGVFVIPEDLQSLFREFCGAAPVSAQRVQ